LPLYFYRRQAEKENLHQSFSGLWPLYHWEITRNESGKVLDYEGRFLIFFESKSRNGARVFKLLGIPVVERTR